MKKIFALFLILSMIFVLASCSDDTEKCDMCVDVDVDGFCDVCGNEYEFTFPGLDGGIQTPIIPIPGT